MIKLGEEVRDVVTGFSGIVTARCEYLNGCVQFCVKPRKIGKDGKIPDGYYIDVKQLEVIGKGVSVLPKLTGGDMLDVPPDHYINN